MATLVVAAVRREMGTDISIANFFRHPSVKGIAALLPEERSAPTAPQTKAESVGANATIIVNEEIPGPALFLFQETSGFASVYQSVFNHIASKIVAFGDEDWGRPDTPEDSVPAAVTKLMPQLREAQPHGPYLLAGWSLGGYMALEAAQQLQAAGEVVSLVMMFDSSVYGRTLQDSRWRAALDPLLDLVDDKNAWLSQFTRCNRMISRYDFSKVSYAGRVVLVKALQGRDPDERDTPPVDPLNGWGPIFPQVEVLSIDSRHRAMFDRTHAPEIGAMIDGVLAEYR